MNFVEAFGRAYDSKLAAGVVRTVRQRAAIEPKLIEHLLDRPAWALADELRRRAEPGVWLERALLRLCKYEPDWTRITELVRTGLTSPL